MATDPKKTLEEDITKAQQAETQEDVDAQDARTRLWQSMNYTYGRQMEQSDKNYQQAMVNTDNQMLNRGMQRSSYGLSLRANLEKQKADATRDILSAQIADYQNRLSEIEQREQEQANWQAQMDWQKEQAAQEQANWQAQMDWQKSESDQKLAYDAILRMLETNDKPSDALLARAGITRHDYNQMKTAANKNKSKGKGRGGKGGTPAQTPAATTPTTPTSTTALLQGLTNFNMPKTTPQTSTPRGSDAKTIKTTTGLNKTAFQYASDDILKRQR